MQLSGELSKVNLANLLQLVKTGGLTGKLTFSQGARLATIFILDGIPIHAETEGEEGVEGLMELFLWTSGAFSFNEEALDGILVSIDDDDPDQSFERLLKDGMSYQEAKHYLDAFNITPKSILKPTGTAVSFAKQVLSMPGLERLDGKSTLAEALADLHLSKREYVRTVSSWMMDGIADVAEPVLLEDMDHVDLPAWVVSRLKQDNPDISQAIVDMVIWVDRVKCWMFQVDVDFYKIRKQIEQSTGGTGDLDDDFDPDDVVDNNVFNPPAEPPTSAMGIYAPTYDSPNYWRGANYYQGGSLFRPTVLEDLSDEEMAALNQDVDQHLDTIAGDKTNPPKPPDKEKKTDQQSIEF
ncbi:MAG: DUF4388 domain-containing protein [Candidatus Melainabacteria bacterium]|nr:DUF4388 domain-containing protein [Candidatus Melainabacteria bacterium]